ncbi:MAG: hypothetical protein V1701_10625 [Planctomycetota bacterium]
MPNVLIIDAAQDSGILLKGILNNYYGVSISESYSEAINKIETALFDAVVIDAPKVNPETSKLISDIKKLIPHLPIIGVPDNESSLEEFAQVINHPINAIKFLKIVHDGINQNQNGKSLHRELSYTTEIYAGSNAAEAIKCRLVNLSLNGMLVENFVPAIGGDIKKERVKFNSFFSTLVGNKKNKFTASLSIKQDNPAKFMAHIAFIDREPNDSIRNIGFGFDNLKQDERQILENLLSAQAA